MKAFVKDLESVEEMRTKPLVKSPFKRAKSVPWSTRNFKVNCMHIDFVGRPLIDGRDN